MNFKDLVGTKMSKPAKFMGAEVKISKLSVAEVMAVQEAAKDASKDASDETKGLGILRQIIRASVEGAQDLTDEEFNNFPMDELSKLSNEIMRFSGIAGEEGKGK